MGMPSLIYYHHIPPCVSELWLPVIFILVVRLSGLINQQPSFSASTKHEINHQVHLGLLTYLVTGLVLRL